MRLLAIAACLLLTGFAEARAQPIQGAWTWNRQGRYGADQNTMQFGPDGSCVRWSNAALTRYWGPTRRYSCEQ